MPGFTVNSIGNGIVQSRASYYYSYTWWIPQLFDDVIVNAGSTSAAPNFLPLIYCKDATLPKFTVGKEAYLAGSVEYKYAKNVTWADCNVTWYDTHGLLAIIKKWRESVWSPDEGLKGAYEYKKVSKIANYTPDADSSKTVYWQLKGSWPSEIRYGDLTYTTSEAKIVEVVITYDWATECVGTIGCLL